ncbi:glycoside hydrolase family 26 protein [Mixia osmundae IAM 14324]|uniref:GH26 domain-containing protein n=1 Tax=Mixia osmundae (strain CBS 9802 / IAM 14324 / JCM 22182 / KY 12970) TaxID=764103 RepID=G7E0B7_MIXOS|nr:glycoside hydrolase family 26 protein [Mixia osmundae IAM 14324]KEI42269.1 glycoside hydrolase family 26 protein [Mixia osmundae IAM 14324]GAA96277.1 hypothetical protein E5Q_02943 [Mixia osmundae IAM 14324]
MPWRTSVPARSELAAWAGEAAKERLRRHASSRNTKAEVFALPVEFRVSIFADASALCISFASTRQRRDCCLTSQNPKIVRCRAASNQLFGLSNASDAMTINGVHIGFLPDWTRENPRALNQQLGKPMQIIGDYLYVAQGDASYSQAQYHYSAIVPYAASSVYAPAILPGFAFNSSTGWTQDLSDGLASMAARFNAKGQTPAAFVAAWRNVHDTIRANPSCNNTFLLWSPNVYTSDPDDLQGYTQYYPGDDYVDIAGISYYAVSRDRVANDVPDDTAFVDGFASFYKLYGAIHPIVISETSAPFNYLLPADFDSSGPDTDISGPLPNTTTLTAEPNSASELDMKMAWFEQMTAPAVVRKYPNLTAISWFNYFKESTNNTLADFRAVGQPDVTTFFRQYIGNSTAFANGYTGSADTLAHHARTLIALLPVVVTILSI